MSNINLYTVRLPRINYRILFVTDIHLVYKEFSSTEGYVVDVEASLLKIIKGAEEGRYNVVILLGDLFDRAYEDVAKALYHIYLIERLNRALKGLLFKVLGNHPTNKKKSYVPTFFLIGEIKSGRIEQDTSLIQQTKDGFIQNYGLKEPLIHCVDRLIVNDCVINLFHYNRYNKDYFDNLEGLDFKPKLHIGCYHDSIMSSVAKKYVNELSNGGKFEIPTITSIENTDVLRNVDYAMVGDIHTRIGEFNVYNESTGITTIVDIPGSIGRTSNTPAQHHNFVDLPLMSIGEQGDYSKSHIRLNLTDYREIFRISESDKNRELDKQMKQFNNAVFDLTVSSNFEDIIRTSALHQEVKEILFKVSSKDDLIPKYRQDEDIKKLL